MKEFMCAQVESISPDSTEYKLVRATPIDLDDSDIKNIKNYIEFKIKTSIFFKGKVILDNIKFVDPVPDGLIVVGTPDGFPLIACWETDQ